MSTLQKISIGTVFLTVYLLGSGNAHPGESTSYRRQVQIRVQINTEVPDYVFFLTPDSVSISSEYLNSRQVVQIEQEWPTDPAENFTVHDINFDGYLDFAIAERGGAKWGIYHYWVFDKSSGQFISNWLTEKLGQFKHNGIYPKAESKEIRVDYLIAGEGLASESYKIEGDRLILVETVDMHFDEENSSIVKTTKRLVDGEMRIVKTEPQ